MILIMKKRRSRIFYFILLLAILLGVYFLASYLYDKNSAKEEYQNYTPQEEISEAQYRETIVNLYFINKENKQIMAEARGIDAKKLSVNPYKALTQLLLEGPQNETLQRVIPEGVTIHDAVFEAGCVIINLSKEILNFGEDEAIKNNIINTIAMTLEELTEVEKICFLIDGEKTDILSEEYSANM